MKVWGNPGQVYNLILNPIETHCIQVNLQDMNEETYLPFGGKGALLNICCNLASTFGQIKFLELFS